MNGNRVSNTRFLQLIISGYMIEWQIHYFMNRLHAVICKFDCST